MSVKARYILATALTAVFAAVCATALLSERKQRSLATCTGIEVSFTDSLGFISARDIKDFLTDSYGPYIGQSLDSVRLDEIERLIESRISVLNSEAWTTAADGLLHVQIVQRAPAMRFETEGGGFYVDHGGYVFPLHKSYTAPVTVVSGKVPFDIPRGFSGYPADTAARRWLAGLVGLEDAIHASRRLKDTVEGISVSPEGDIVLSLKGTAEKFIIGAPVDIDEKFDKIDKYFGYIVPVKGEGHYKTVNLKYKNQIICRQKDT